VGLALENRVMYWAPYRLERSKLPEVYLEGCRSWSVHYRFGMTGYSDRQRYIRWLHLLAMSGYSPDIVPVGRK